jgi:hypothetical protein
MTIATSPTVSAPSTEQLVNETDHFQLGRLVLEHAWRTDNGRADTIYELYTEDGVLDVGTGALVGHDAIREWGRKLVEAPPWGTIRHSCSNLRFVADGPDAAEGSCVLTVFMETGPGQGATLPWNVGEDHDRFVRTDEGWKFVSRRWVNLFTRGDVINIP